MKAIRTLFGAAALAMLCASSLATAQTTTREQVKAETKAAKAAGTMPGTGEANNVKAEPASTKTRAEVKAETKTAKDKGDGIQKGEGTSSEPTAKTGAVARKRSDVKAEATAKAGKIPGGEK